MRASEADLRQLGVHAAISVPGVLDDVSPEYVPRDADAGGHGVRDRVAAAAARGGFVLLVGGSSVGKTRCAAVAVRALLPDWWLVHPGGPGEVAALAAAKPARTVVWLDELQRYLDGKHGLTGGVVRALLTAPGPVVLIGTLWPDRYTAYTAMPSSGGVDPHCREREVLDLAVVVRIGAAFSLAEQNRARAAAARDRRLAAALGAGGYGLTQTLAAAPQLVARWQDAQDAKPYAWAVMTAAMDAARLGARAPLPAGLLRAAAPGYCTSAQQAEAPDRWFEQALGYATEKLHGAAAVLAPAGAGMGEIAGYTVADYLIQQASRERRHARVPTSTWDALLSHIRDPADATRLADSATGRLLYCYATPLYRYAADAGDPDAAVGLAWLLAQRGEQDEAMQILRARADAGDTEVARQLAWLLAQRGDLDEAMQILRARADAGDQYAVRHLAVLLAQRGDLDEAMQILRARADAGDGPAARQRAALLANCGDLDGLRARADAGDPAAADRLAELLTERGDLDEAMQILRAPADAGDTDTAIHLAVLLAQRGEEDEAMQILRARADAGDEYAAELLNGLPAELHMLLAEPGDLDMLLAEPGDLDGLRARADALQLAVMLTAHGDLGEAMQILRAPADAGDTDAAALLADLLAEYGDLDGAVHTLHALANAGSGDAGQLAELLTRQGRGEEAERLRRDGLNPDGSIAYGGGGTSWTCLTVSRIRRVAG